MSKEEIISCTLVGGSPWGFQLQGGREHGVPLTVAIVTRGGGAEKAGLREGDLIIEINGYTASLLTHSNALKVIGTSGNTLYIKVDKQQRYRDCSREVRRQPEAKRVDDSHSESHRGRETTKGPARLTGAPRIFESWESPVESWDPSRGWMPQEPKDSERKWTPQKRAWTPERHESGWAPPLQTRGPPPQERSWVLDTRQQLRDSPQLQQQHAWAPPPQPQQNWYPPEKNSWTSSVHRGSDEYLKRQEAKATVEKALSGISLPQASSITVPIGKSVTIELSQEHQDAMPNRSYKLPYDVQPPRPYKPPSPEQPPAPPAKAYVPPPEKAYVPPPAQAYVPPPEKPYVPPEKPYVPPHVKAQPDVADISDILLGKENKPISDLLSKTSPGGTKYKWEVGKYAAEDYPSVEEQKKMCKTIAQSLFSEVNAGAPGGKMFKKRVEKSNKWTKEGVGRNKEEPKKFLEKWSDIEELEKLDSNDQNKQYAIPPPPPLPDISSILKDQSSWKSRKKDVFTYRNPNSSEVISIAPTNFDVDLNKAGRCKHDTVTPKICQQLIMDLSSESGSGSLMFQKRKTKSEKWVKDESNVNKISPGVREVLKNNPGAKIQIGGKPKLGNESMVDALAKNKGLNHVSLVKSPWEAALETGSVDSAFETSSLAGMMSRPSLMSEAMSRSARMRDAGGWSQSKTEHISRSNVTGNKSWQQEETKTWEITKSPFALPAPQKKLI